MVDDDGSYYYSPQESDAEVKKTKSFFTGGLETDGVPAELPPPTLGPMTKSLFWPLSHTERINNGSPMCRDQK